MNIAMMPDAVMAARQNDANTAGALEAAQDAVSAGADPDVTSTVS